MTPFALFSSFDDWERPLAGAKWLLAQRHASHVRDCWIGFFVILACWFGLLSGFVFWLVRVFSRRFLVFGFFVFFLVPSFVSAAPPLGFPLVISGDWIDSSVSPPVSFSRVLTWSDDASAWICSSSSDGMSLSLGAGSVVSDSVLGISGDWSRGPLGGEVSGGSYRFVPESVDYGDTWDASRIAWLYTYGFAAGCAVHFSSWGVVYLMKGFFYALVQLMA